MSGLGVTGAGVSVPTAASSSTGSAVALQAQLLKQRAQLADWECCVSSKTPEGKAHIAALSRELAATQSQIRKIEAAAPAGTSVAVRTVQASHRGALDVWA